MQPNTTPPAASTDKSVLAYMYKVNNVEYAAALMVKLSSHTFSQPTFANAPQLAWLDKLDNKEAPVFAITKDREGSQLEHGEILEAKCGFHRLLRFSGTYGNPLSLWVKPRVGDRKSMRGPLVKPIKNKATASMVNAATVSFAGCCGARICVAPERASAVTSRHPEDHPCFPRCLKDKNAQINIFMLCEESKTEVLDTLKDTGFIPIYRYTTPEGVAFLMLFRDYGHNGYTKIPAVLYGRTEKSILDIIKRLQGIKT